jgi:hypothetical protein
MRITWKEPDGTEKYDTEDLHILLRAEMLFKLVVGPRGEALYLRGAARVEHDAAQPKRTVTIKYTDGAIEKEQVWTFESPHAIVDDARTEPRFKAKLARRVEDIGTPFECWYNAALSHPMLSQMELFMNQRLDGKRHETRKTSRGELVRYLCYMGAIATQPGKPVRSMWQRAKGPKDCFPPAAIGQYGLGCNRFMLLQRMAGELYPLNEVGLDPANKWRFCDMPVKCYNAHMADVFEPGWNTGPDESMSAWRGATGDKPHECRGCRRSTTRKTRKTRAKRRRTTTRRAKTTEGSLGSSITWAGDAAAGAGEGRSML